MPTPPEHTPEDNTLFLKIPGKLSGFVKDKHGEPVVSECVSIIDIKGKQYGCYYTSRRLF